MSCRAPNARNASVSAALGVVEHAEHERDGVVRYGRLDLRQARLDAAPADELGELAEQAVDGRHEHGATPHVRDVRRRALAKTDEHALLARNVLDAEPRAPAIVPRSAHDGRQPLARLDAPDALQRLRDDLLLECDLRRVREMLQRAAAAAAEVLALGRHARRRRLEHPHELGLLDLAAALAQRDLDALAGQRVGDEHSPPVEIGDAHAVVREIDDRGARYGRRQPACRVVCQSSRYSLQVRPLGLRELRLDDGDLVLIAASRRARRA